MVAKITAAKDDDWIEVAHELEELAERIRAVVEDERPRRPMRRMLIEESANDRDLRNLLAAALNLSREGVAR